MLTRKRLMPYLGLLLSTLLQMTGLLLGVLATGGEQLSLFIVAIVMWAMGIIGMFFPSVAQRVFLKRTKASS